LNIDLIKSDDGRNNSQAAPILLWLAWQLRPGALLVFTLKHVYKKSLDGIDNSAATIIQADGMLPSLSIHADIH
jgi:hypothetical protein